MELASLGYIGLAGQDLAAWRRFSQRVLGTQSCSRTVDGVGDLLALRMDEKCHRFILLATAQDDAAWFGLELPDEGAWDTACAQLRARGIPLALATPAELAVRQVRCMAWLRDPSGNRLELYAGLANDAAGFTPDRPVGGFCTGEYGLGHVVFVVEDLERTRDFYTDVLGFRVSDYVLTPNRRVFMRINGRHHSIALAERQGSGIAHVMVEVNEFDDVGRSYDVALADYPEGIYSTLGRHSNDHMTSFYVNTPAGFPIEYGWGGRVVDERTWQVTNLFGPSLWGHDRVGASSAARAAANEQRQIAFREGLRAPLAPQGDRHVE